MKPSPQLTRRRFIKLGGLLAGSLLASPFAGFGYSRYLEPRLLQVKELTLTFPRLPSEFNGLRIVQFSDVHLDFHYGLDRLEKLVSRIQNLDPDLVCFTGDMYDTYIGEEASGCSRILSRLKAPLGKWAVLGNHDYTAGSRHVAEVMAEGGFSMLINRSGTIERNGSRLRIAGVDDVLKGSADLERALPASTGDLFTILLAHEPDLADEALRFPVDLQLSGHSHGGQVRVPFYGAVFTPEYARKYIDGLFELGQGRLKLYVNRGIGVSTHPIRFWCLPELTVFTLRQG
ncbi:metallophosphoesterase [Paenibacillus gansuensis]|uniref:Metallophosphoesterase n=1 Tax=Paenibacillus gansuensis TaxID=306542 RepID=A0ABW5PF05_9BACL